MALHVRPVLCQSMNKAQHRRRSVARQKSKMLSRCRRRLVIGCLCLHRTLVLTCPMQVFCGVECTPLLVVYAYFSCQWMILSGMAGHLQRGFVSLLHDSHVLHLLTCSWTPGQQEVSP